jgi:hypothetical protein
MTVVEIKSFFCDDCKSGGFRGGCNVGVEWETLSGGFGGGCGNEGGRGRVEKLSFGGFGAGGFSGGKSEIVKTLISGGMGGGFSRVEWAENVFLFLIVGESNSYGVVN